MKERNILDETLDETLDEILDKIAAQGSSKLAFISPRVLHWAYLSVNISLNSKTHCSTDIANSTICRLVATRNDDCMGGLDTTFERIDESINKIIAENIQEQEH